MLTTQIRQQAIAAMAICCLIFCSNAHARSYTTVQSGLYTDGAVWAGGIAPPLTLHDTDAVFIGNHTVMLNVNIKVDSASELHVQAGVLQQQGKGYIHLHHAHLAVMGTLEADSISCTGRSRIDASASSFTGNTLSCADSTRVSAVIPPVIKKALHLRGMLNSSGIVADTAAIIYMEGGWYQYPHLPNLIMPSVYDVVYTSIGAWGSIGQEAGGKYLRDVVVDIGANTIGMSDTMAVNGTLYHRSGNICISWDMGLVFERTSNYVANTGCMIDNASISNRGPFMIIRADNGLDSPITFTANSWLALLEVDMGKANSTVKLGQSLFANVLNLRSGRVDVMSNILSCGNNGMGHSGHPGGSSGAYIITEGGGALGMFTNNGNATMFPIGTYSHYLPCSVTSNINDMASVGLMPHIYAYGKNGYRISDRQPCVNLTWHILPIRNSTISIQACWDTSFEKNGFKRHDAYISQYRGTQPWDNHISSAATFNTVDTTYNLQRHELMAEEFKPVSFAVFDKNTNVSVNDIVTRGTVAIYPNPATNTLHIAVKQQATATIYNTAVQAVRTANIDAANNSINIAALAAGTYYISVTGAQSGTATFVKQ